MTSELPRLSADQVRERIAGAFSDARIEVDDDSHLHAGHAGATGGAGHYSTRIVSTAFEGRSLMARHRLVYDAVRDWMPARIHALRIDARTPQEADSPPTPRSAAR